VSEKITVLFTLTTVLTKKYTVKSTKIARFGLKKILGGVVAILKIGSGTIGFPSVMECGQKNPHPPGGEGIMAALLCRLPYDTFSLLRRSPNPTTDSLAAATDAYRLIVFWPSGCCVVGYTQLLINTFFQFPYKRKSAHHCKALTVIEMHCKRRVSTSARCGWPARAVNHLQHITDTRGGWGSEGGVGGFGQKVFFSSF
jgi:hypothetical protein